MHCAQEVLHSGNREDFTVSNLKIGLGVLTWVSSQSCVMPRYYRTVGPLTPHRDVQEFRRNAQALSDIGTHGLYRCCWALLAQFYPKKYPHNWHVLVLSLACYLACTAGLSALSWFMERDSFLFACKVPVSGLCITLCYT